MSNLASDDIAATSKKLDLFGVYSEAGEIELVGTSQGYRDLANALIAKNQLNAFFSLNTPDLSFLKSYGHYFKALHIMTEKQREVKIDYDHETLEVSGSVDNLEILAQNIMMLSKQTQHGYHLHIEYLPINVPGFRNYLAPNSKPLVMTIENKPLT